MRDGISRAPRRLYPVCVSRALPIGLVFFIATLARAEPPCHGPRPQVDLPSACVGETAASDTAFCFGDGGCLGVGFVHAIVPPDPPFVVTAVHVDGPLGSARSTSRTSPCCSAWASASSRR
jgi:hypothetical protein